MHSIAHYAAAIILTSALGAFVLCLLVIRYGFTPAEDEPLPARHRRFFITRLGHALGAVCFAITAGLAAVAITVTPPAPAPPAPEGVSAASPIDIAPIRAGQARLAHDVRTLDERIERTEAGLAELRATMTAAASRPSVTQRTPRRAVAGPPRGAADDHPARVAPERAPESAGPATAIPQSATSVELSPVAAVAEQSAAGPTARERTRAALRTARERMSRFGEGIKARVVMAGRAVREFLADL
jgi:hypothetical protein